MPVCPKHTPPIPASSSLRPERAKAAAITLCLQGLLFLTSGQCSDKRMAGRVSSVPHRLHPQHWCVGNCRQRGEQAPRPAWALHMWRGDCFQGLEPSDSRAWLARQAPCYHTCKRVGAGLPHTDACQTPRLWCQPSACRLPSRSRSRSPRRRAHSPERRREERSMPTAYRMSSSPGASRKRARSR